jgi:hypothetical protein
LAFSVQVSRGSVISERSVCSRRRADTAV